MVLSSMNFPSREELERRIEEGHQEIQRSFARMIALLEEEIAEHESAHDALPVSTGEHISSEDASDSMFYTLSNAGENFSSMELDDLDSGTESIVDEIHPPTGQTDSLSANSLNAMPFLVEEVTPTNDVDDKELTPMMMNLPEQAINTAHPSPSNSIFLHGSSRHSSLPLQFLLQITVSVVNRRVFDEMPLRNIVPKTDPTHQFRDLVTRSEVFTTPDRLSLPKPPDRLTVSMSSLVRPILMLPRRPPAKPPNQERKLNAVRNSKSDIVGTFVSLDSPSVKHVCSTCDDKPIFEVQFDGYGCFCYPIYISSFGRDISLGAFDLEVWSQPANFILFQAKYPSNSKSVIATCYMLVCSPCYATIGSSSANYHVFIRELLPSIQIKVYCNVVYQLLLIYMVSKTNPLMSFQAVATKPWVFDTRPKLPPPKPPDAAGSLILQWKPLLLKLAPRPPAKPHDQVHQGIFSYLWGTGAYFNTLNRVIMSKRIGNSSYIGKMTTTLVIANVLKHFMHQYRFEVGLIQRLVSLDGCGRTIGIFVLALNLIQVKITSAFIVFKRVSYKDFVTIPAHHVLQPALNCCEVAVEIVTMIPSSTMALPSPLPEPPDWDYCIVVVTFAADKCTCWLESYATAIANEDEHVEVILSLCNSVIKTFRFSLLLLEGSLTINHRTLRCDKVLFHIIVPHSSDFKLRSEAFHGDSKFGAISLPIVILSFVHFDAIIWDTVGQMVSNKPQA